MRNILTKVLVFLKNITTTKCQKCIIGRVSHNHSEIHKRTWVEVYKCDKCHTEFI